MGTFEKGILGGFSGKVGTVVGSSWRGINVMKSLPTISKNRTFSARQLEQQARFSLMTAFLSPVRPFLEIGFKSGARQMTGYNSAFGYNIKTAISGTYPALAIEYSAAATSRGELPRVVQALASPGAAGKLDVSWTDNSGTGKALATDQLMLLVHCPDAHDSTYLIGAATRADGAYTLDLPPGYSGKQVHVYVSFASQEGTDISDSVYSGPVTIV